MTENGTGHADQQRGIRAHRFKKGQSGNPKGRPPKAKAIPDILARIGAEELPEPMRQKMRTMFPNIPDDVDFLEAVCRVLFSRALKGESWAVAIIFERTEGKVTDKLKIDGGQKLLIVEEIVDASGNATNRSGDPVREEPAQE